MERERIILSALWLSLMLIYFLGDVIRIFAGDFTPGLMQGKPLSRWMKVFIALFMMIPIAMMLLSLVLDTYAIQLSTWIASGALFLFNLAGLPSYKGLYDKMLIVFGLGLNVLTFVYALKHS
jgi:hypothetical protein